MFGEVVATIKGTVTVMLELRQKELLMVAEVVSALW